MEERKNENTESNEVLDLEIEKLEIERKRLKLEEIKTHVSIAQAFAIVSSLLVSAAAFFIFNIDKINQILEKNTDKAIREILEILTSLAIISGFLSVLSVGLTFFLFIKVFIETERHSFSKREKKKKKKKFLKIFLKILKSMDNSTVLVIRDIIIISIISYGLIELFERFLSKK